MKFLTASTPDYAKPDRGLFWAALVLAIVPFTTVVLFIPLLIMTRGWESQFQVNTALLWAGCAVMVGCSLWLLRRGQTLPATLLLLLRIVTAMAGLTWLMSGLGLITSVATLLLATSVLAVAKLSQKATAALVPIIILAGIAIWVGDTYGSAVRLPAPETMRNAVLTLVPLETLLLAAMALRQLGNFPLRVKLMLAFVGMTALATGAVALFDYFSIRDPLIAETGAKLNTLAITQSQNVGNLLVKEADLLESFNLAHTLREQIETVNSQYTGDAASIQAELDRLDKQWRAADAANNDEDPLVSAKLHDPLSEMLRQYRTTFPENVEVFITDKHGALLAATNRTSDYYQADEAWWQSAYRDGQGALFIGQPEFDQSSASYSVILAQPIYAEHKRGVTGVIRTTVNMNEVYSALLTAYTDKTIDFDLVFPDNSILSSHSHAEQVPAQTLDQIRTSQVTYLTLPYYGNEPYVVSLARVATTDPDRSDAINALNWNVITHQEEIIAFSPMNRVQQTGPLFTLIVLAVAALVGLGLAQFLSRPIRRLTAVAERISAGDLGAQATVESNDEIGLLARAFNNTTARLRALISSLEQRVADRTRALTLTAEISRRLSSILDQQQLVTEVVEQIKSAFNYSQVHLYLYDAQRDHLVLAGGTGEAAQTMLADGYRLEEGSGLVGRAAGANAPILIPDTAEDSSWQIHHSLLSDTRAELAVPIALGGRVLGVLDVLHNRPDSLGPEDVLLLQSIASQVAIALQNTRSYRQAQERAERETFIVAVGEKIQRANTLEDVLSIAAQELGQKLNARRATAEVGVNPRPDMRRE